MKKIIIGAPVYKREWVLNYWFQCLEKQDYPLENIGFLFELGPDDDATHDLLWRWHQMHPEVTIFDGVIRNDVKHRTHEEGTRQWEIARYYVMADFRNSLLDRALCHDFDYYFSLDSDILLDDPSSLRRLVEYMDRGLDIVSPLSFMTPHDANYPSVMSWAERVGKRAWRDLNKVQWGTLFEADIVMASVMMSRKVVENVRYIWHPQGEDLGFAWELNRAGIKSYCAGDIYGFHAMGQELLQSYIQRGREDSRNFFARPLSV